MSSATRYRLFAVVTPGLEPLLERELERLLPNVDRQRHIGGVEVRVSREQMWLLARRSRLAEGLRVRVGRFESRDFGELRRRLARIPWHAYLPRAARPPIKVATKRSALYHSGAVEQRTREVLRGKLGEPPSDEATGDDPAAAAVYLRLRRDVVDVSIDASGERLHKRGYRTRVGKAPLRETLAAACLEVAALPDDQPLWDPFCGGGTLVIEALQIRLGRPAGADRAFAFERWPTHDDDAYAAWCQSQASDGREIASPGPDEPAVRAYGSDRDPDEIAAARSNAEAAGVGAVASFVEADVGRAFESVPSGCAVITNLPYGHRTRGGDDLSSSLLRFGQVLARRPDLEPVWALAAQRDLAALTGRDWRAHLRFRNRGLPVALHRLVRHPPDE